METPPPSNNAIETARNSLLEKQGALAERLKTERKSLQDLQTAIKKLQAKIEKYKNEANANEIKTAELQRFLGILNAFLALITDTEPQEYDGLRTTIEKEREALEKEAAELKKQYDPETQEGELQRSFLSADRDWRHKTAEIDSIKIEGLSVNHTLDLRTGAQRAADQLHEKRTSIQIAKETTAIKIAEIQKALQLLQKLLTLDSIRDRHINADIKSIEEEIERFKKDRGAAEKDLQKHQQNLAQKQNAAEAQEKTVGELEVELGKLNEYLQTVDRAEKLLQRYEKTCIKYSGIQTRFNSAASNYTDAIKTIMETRRKLVGAIEDAVFDVTGDLIEKTGYVKGLEEQTDMQLAQMDRAKDGLINTLVLVSERTALNLRQTIEQLEALLALGTFSPEDVAGVEADASDSITQAKQGIDKFNPEALTSKIAELCGLFGVPDLKTLLEKARAVKTAREAVARQESQANV